MKLGFLKSTCILVSLFLSLFCAKSQTFTSVASGDWDDPATWDVGSTTPGVGDDVIISGGHTVTLPFSVSSLVQNVTIEDGELDLQGTLVNLGGSFTMSPSSVTSSCVLNLNNSGVLGIQSGGDFTFTVETDGSAAQQIIMPDGSITIDDGSFTIDYQQGGSETLTELAMSGTSSIVVTPTATGGDFNITYSGLSGQTSNFTATLLGNSSITAKNITLTQAGVAATTTGDLNLEVFDNSTITTNKHAVTGGNFIMTKGGTAGSGNINVENGESGQSDASVMTIAGNMELTFDGSLTNAGTIQYGQYSTQTTNISENITLSSSLCNDVSGTEDIRFYVRSGTLNADHFEVILDNNHISADIDIQIGNSGSSSANVTADTLSFNIFPDVSMTGPKTGIARLNLYQNSMFNVNTGMNILYGVTNSGSTNMQVNLNDDSEMSVTNDITIDNDETGSTLRTEIGFQLSDNSSLTVGSDFTFDSTDPDRITTLALAGNSQFTMGGNFSFTDPTIPDALTMASTSTIEFASSAEQQQIPHRDSFTYGRVVINNTSPDGVILFGEPSDKVIFEGPLAMENGVLFTNDLMLILNDTASSSSTSTFVDGAIHKPLFGLKTDNSMLFPLGDADAGVRGLIETSFPSGFDSNDTVAIEYIHSDPLYRNYGTLAAASAIEYWLIDVHEEGSSQIMNIRLLWDDGDVSQVPPDPADITVAYVDLSETWIDLGNSANAINASSPFNGFVSANTGVINKNIFDNPNPTIISFGSTVAGVLPVELVDFEVRSENESAILSWSTASELNNDYFQIERSRDGLNFVPIGKVNGAGTTNAWQEYEFVDSYPFLPVSYYRLKQVDYDGTTSYSDIKYLSFSKQNLSSAIKIAPNPAVHRIATLQVDIDALHMRESYSMQLLDLSGKVIFESLNIPSNQQSIPLDLSQVQVSSILLVKITTDLGKVYQTKLLTGK